MTRQIIICLRLEPEADPYEPDDPPDYEDEPPTSDQCPAGCENYCCVTEED